MRIEEQVETELRRLVGVLEELMLSSRRSQRDVERELDLGNGYLSHLFKGRRELKVKHILMLGKVLGFDLLGFAERAYRRRGRTPEWALQQMESGTWELRGPGPLPPLAAPALAAMSSTSPMSPMSPMVPTAPTALPPLDEERIRQLVRDEVRRLGLGGDGSDRPDRSDRDRGDRGAGLEPPRPGIL